MTPLSLGIFASANLSAAATSFESIATVTVGSGGASSVTFSSIATDWTHLQIRYLGRNTESQTQSYYNIRFNSDSGSNYAYHYIEGTGSAVSAGASSSIAQIYTGLVPGGNASGSIFGVSVIDILDYKDTNKFKTLRYLGGNDLNGSGFISLVSGLWRSTNAITSISFTAPSGNIAQYSHFALYGVKSA